MKFKTRLRRAWHELRSTGYGRPAFGSPGLMQGGIVNPLTGMGGSSDKSEHSFFTPTRIHWRGELEILRVQSWAAKKFIEIPVDDQFIRWRKFEATDNEAAAEAMEESEKRHKVTDRLADAMKNARLYGTGLLLMVTKEATLDMPLMPERIRPGDLRALHSFDRYDASVWKRDSDAMSPGYGQPISYFLTPTRGPRFEVHASRVLRFDGIKPLSSDGFTIYDFDWGVSEIVPVILAIMQDQTAATGAAHLTQEASILWLQIEGLREALATGNLDKDEASAQQIGEQINQLKSIYRILMTDKTENLSRIAVNWSGMADILDRFSARLAAAADIPQTRFWGSPPVGMSATGESDMRNYIMMLEADRAKKLPTQLDRLDMVLARDAGLREPPAYSWLSLIELGEQEKAEAAKIKAEAAKTAVDSGLIDEDEGRKALDGDEFFGALAEGEAPGLPEPVLPPGPMNPPREDK